MARKYKNPWGPLPDELQQALYLIVFKAAYTVAMLWVNTLTEDGEFDDEMDNLDLVSPAASEQMAQDCRAFVEANWADLQDLNPAECGHDFALTRNGHGAGFWDRGYGDVGDRLSKACEPYGSQNLIRCGDTIEVL